MFAFLAALLSPRFLIYSVLFGLVGGFFSGYWVKGKFEDARRVAELNETIARERGNLKLVIRTERIIQQKIIHIRTKGKDIVREIPVYITPETDKRFAVPTGFVRLHDAAATGEPAGAPAISDGEASGVTHSRAAEVVADNYTEARVWREQVIGWQKFYQEVRENLASCR